MNHQTMTADDYLSLLVNDIHSTVISTIGQDNRPKSRIIDMMLTKTGKLYFLTANFKPFYTQLQNNSAVSITGRHGTDTMSSYAITVEGDVREIGNTYLDEIMDKNPYMKDLYPTPEKRATLSVFEIYHGTVAIFDLSVTPPYQAAFQLGH